MSPQIIGAAAGLLGAFSGLYGATFAILWQWHNQQVRDLIAQRDGALRREDAAIDLAQHNQAGFDAALKELRRLLNRQRGYDPVR